MANPRVLSHCNWQALLKGFVLFAWAWFAAVAHGQVNQGAVVAPADHAVRLDGMWHFTPGPTPDVATPAPAAPAADATLLQVPGNWHRLQSVFGEGTYRLELHQLQVGRTYALQFKGIASEAIVRINDTQIGLWGEQGLSFVPQVYFFQATGTQAMLTVAVRNKDLSFSGLWMPVYFGPAEAVTQVALQTQFFDALLLGGVLIIAIYHLGLFGFRPHDPAPLYFSIFSLLSVLKASLSGEHLLYTVLPWLDQGVGLRIAYLATIALPITFMAYLQALFPVRHYEKACHALLVVALPAMLLSLLAPFHTLQAWFWPYQIAIVGVLIHVAMTLTGAIRQRLPGAQLMYAGFIVIFAAAINDILHDNRLIVTFYAFNIGVFVFLLLQALLMGGMFARAFNQAQDLNETLEHKVRERTRELEDLSHRDPLTGLMNRRWFWENLLTEWDRWTRYEQDFCLALIDLDHFKKINDTRGHIAGDEALIQLAQLLQQQFRKTDKVARYGGEEFCVLLPGTRIGEARAVMEKVRNACAQQLGFTFTYGVGRASLYLRPEDLVNSADRHMYAAKQAGRNQGQCDPAS